MAKTQTVKLNYLRMAPRKVRLLAHSIKGLSVSEAEAQLVLNAKRAAEPLLKLLRSGMNAAKNQEIDPAKLAVKEIRVDQGPVLKRMMPRAQGRGTPIRKKSSHIILVLEEVSEAKAARFKITKRERLPKSEKKEKIKISPKAKAEGEEKSKSRGFVKRMFRRKAV